MSMLRKAPNKAKLSMMKDVIYKKVTYRRWLSLGNETKPIFMVSS